MNRSPTIHAMSNKKERIIRSKRKNIQNSFLRALPLNTAYFFNTSRYQCIVSASFPFYSCSSANESKSFILLPSLLYSPTPVHVSAMDFRRIDIVVSLCCPSIRSISRSPIFVSCLCFVIKVPIKCSTA